MNYKYDAWGNLTNTPEGVTTGNGELLREANPFRYCSYQFDPETELYYLKARYYNPALARFLAKDPMLSINSYAYAVNNPVNFIDTDGTWVALEGPGSYAKPITFYESAKSTLKSPGTAFSTTTGGNEYIFKKLEKSAVKAVTNQKFPSSVAKGMRAKTIAKETAEVTAALGGASKFLKVAGDYGGPIVDIATGIYTINQDIKQYSGQDLTKAIAVTTVATVASVGIGIFLATTSLPILVGLGIGVMGSVLIDFLAVTIKYYLTED